MPSSRSRKVPAITRQGTGSGWVARSGSGQKKNPSAPQPLCYLVMLAVVYWRSNHYSLQQVRVLVPGVGLVMQSRRALLL